MIIDYNNKDKNKGFSDSEKGILQNLFFDLDKLPNRLASLSDFEKFQIEYITTDILQKLLDYYNKYFFNFKL